MKGQNIGIIGRWNATCGVSLHAELLGRELMKRGYKVTIFGPYLHSASRWWHYISTRKDEDVVVRCFEEISPDGQMGHIEINKITSAKLDALIIESWQSLPQIEVEKIVLELRKKGVPSFIVIHEGYAEDLKYSSLNIFEKVILFTKKYLEITKDKVERGKIEIILYPCVPIKDRRRGFGDDGKITFFSFGRQPIKEYTDYIEALRGLREQFFNIAYKVIRCKDLLPLRNEEWIDQRKKIIDLEEIYAHLGNSDIHLIPKGQTNGVVVSSTLCQTLGSLCPAVAPNTNHFEDVAAQSEHPPLVVYENHEDLKEKIRKLILDKDFRLNLRKAARKYVTENSVNNVTQKFINLFNLH